MKKLFNSKFLFILASSLVVLILLTVGAFYLFDDEDDVFVKSGYVLNPLSSTSEKYFFDESVGYRENLSSMIEFVDVDENTVSILKDSFIHYLDESLSLLKNGAILDLDSINGNKAVSFYNITNESIIEKKDSGYIIESANGEIKFNNFIARISDNKYIVVGDLSLKMAGNSTTIKGDYFEIVYVEEGIVNIENKDVKYQVAADNTYINVGNDKVIDLGDKMITVNDIDVMSITAITIDGDENIEIIPKGNDDEEEDSPSGNEENQGNENDTVGDGQGNQTDTNVGDGTGDNTTGESGEGGTGNENIETDETEEVIISLKDFSAGSTNIDVTFDVVNAHDNDKFMLQVVNLASGRTVDMVAQVLTDVEIKVNLLTPNTKYLFMVVNEKDNAKYFQKVLETTGFGIKLDKAYATDSSLAYKITVEEGTDITNAKLTLYKFNEETMKNEVVTESYEDSTTGEIKTVDKVISLSSLTDNIEGEHEVLFDGLESNSIYTAVLDEFSVASSNFKDIYNVSVTSMTLKKIPGFNEMNIIKDVGKASFDLSLSEIDDPDNAIVKYTYMIYNREDDSLAIRPIEHKNASPISVKVGDGENELKSDTNYYYKVIIEYFDNEKYIEYVTTDSITFMMGEEPYITVVPNEEQVSYDSIGATIYLTDNSCLISIPGREKCNGASTTVVEVSKINAVTGERIPIHTKAFDFEITDEGIKYDLFLDELQSGTTYNIEVKASYNNVESLEKKELIHTDESKRTISTHSLSSFNVDWTDMGSSENHVVNVKSKFLPIQGTGTMTPEETAASLEQVVISLYEGNDVKDLDRRLPIAKKFFVNSDEFNLKEKFYDNGYVISSSDTFGISMQSLKDKSDNGELSEYYTILIEAYYDTEGINEATLFNDVIAYKISPALLMQDVETLLGITPISNKQSGGMFSNLINSGTIVGYKLTAAFDKILLESRGLIAKKVNFYVYDYANKSKLNFYIKNEDGNLEEVNKYSIDITDKNGTYFSGDIYMDYGTSYETTDTLMRRGNYFFVGYEIEAVDDEEQTWLYPMADNPNSPSDYGIYDSLHVEKETPTVKMYIAKSTEDSITYSYNIKDPDNALYKDLESEKYSFYYNINSGDELALDIEQIQDVDYNQFEGKITINGLQKDDRYSLYYKKNNLKSGNLESDVVNYIDGGSGIRIFEGFYDFANDVDKYNFRYQIINDPLKDNRVVIKILADESIIGRILSYRIDFKDSKGHTLSKELWKLTTCSSDSTERCLTVDYIDLKNAGMKSELNETNLITVTVSALYDNGLMGYDYKVGSSSTDDYMYCIMQDNSSESGMGNYIVFSSSGREITTWSEAIDIPKGYYTYSLNNSLLYYKSELNKSHRMNISINLSSVGYSSKNGILNPKMVSVDEIECVSNSDSSCNTFSFSSITPKVLVREKAKIINGAAMNFTLSGIDLSEVKNEGTASSPEYYLYIETWDDPNKAGQLSQVVRPTVKVKINNEVPTKTISAIIDGLKEYNVKEKTGTYYFNVYANMYKDGVSTYTQLFDAGVSDRYDVKTYSFDSAKISDLFREISVGYTSSNEIYGNRSLNSKISLWPYNGIPFNFDVIYVLCDVDNSANCGPNDESGNIFKKDILIDSVATSMDDSVDISEYDLEFNKQYNLMVYVNTDYYDTENNIMTKRAILINTNYQKVTLKKLSEPSFVVTRNAMLENGEYMIDFNIVVNDADRTLVDGNYFIKLVNTAGEVVGNMQLQDEDGNYYDVSNYHEYAFDAFVVNKKVRITGLEADTKYTFVVYNDAYINNFDDGVTLPGRENRTFEISKSYTVYSTNDYGVAFGTATYAATASSIVVTFLGGSNFNNVVEVNYTVGNWDDAQASDTLGGTFAIGKYNDSNVEYEAIGKSFEIYSNSEDWRFVVDPAGMRNILGKTYQVIISFKIKVPGTEDEYIVLTHDDVESFKDTVTYYED